MTVPAGTWVAIPSSAIHLDEEIYSNPKQFDGFRFAKRRHMNDNVPATGHLAVSTSHEHLAFGLGRYAW
jgi:cytochrome P450